MGAMTDKWKAQLLLPGEKPPRNVPAWAVWLATVIAIVASVLTIAVLVSR